MSLYPEIEMTREEIDGFLAAPRIAVLGSIDRDGRPSLNPAWYEWDGAAFRFSVNRTLYYARNLLRDPRATLLVQDEAIPRKAVVAHGRVEVEPDRENGLLRRLFLRYYGPEDGPREFTRSWKLEGADALAFTLVPERLASWDNGKGRGAGTQEALRAARRDEGEAG